MARPAPGLCEPARRARYAATLRHACLTEQHPPGTDRTGGRTWETPPPAAVALPPGPATAPYASADLFMAPLRRNAAGGPQVEGRRWEGCAPKKPWEYRVSAAIVHLDAPGPLADVLATLRAQTERPYLIVIDSGSLAEHRRALEEMELASDDLEVIYHRPRGWRMSSQPIAAAMDMAFAICQTEYLYATHTDVFLKRPDALDYLVKLCDARTPAVGWQMSPRPHMREVGVWENTLSHTATVYHMPTMRRIRAAWNMIRTYERFDLTPKQPEVGDPLYPDTEVEIGYVFRESGIGVRWLGDPPPGPDDPPSVLMLGTEDNAPYQNEWYEHVRSYTLAAQYNQDWAAVRAPLMDGARTVSRNRVAAWRSAAPARAAAVETAHRVAAWRSAAPARVAAVETARRLAKARTCPDRTEEGQHG